MGGRIDMDQITRLKEAIETADAIVIGAGAGLSTSAGFTYSGERFQKYFSDFEEEYGFHDMYSGGFYVMQLEPEISWAYWARNIYINRFMKTPKPLYDRLLEIVKEKNYFVLTTNVDHQFQKAGFDKERIFYTQGDYGLWQCSKPCHKRTYNNKDKVIKMIYSQGFTLGERGELLCPQTEDGKTDFSQLSQTVSSDLVPYCPVCGEPMSMNLRADATFVEDDGWHDAADRYADYLRKHKDGNILFLELGVGGNTPGIIKYPFWQMTLANKNATYACINFGEAVAPNEIKEQSICINADIGSVLEQL
ncbi:MAG: hypothetical protein IJV59_04945 [Eubacterium sp.]|nr:hypothetical protein [Eubacterium sp.]